MSVVDAAATAVSAGRNLDTDTCCPEEAELIPCTACYEKHQREKGGEAEPSLTLLLSPPLPEPTLPDVAASASLLRVPPPEIPHGHAASAPEDITHHESHARQLPAPIPPDPSSTAVEVGAGRVKQPQVEAVDTGAAGRERKPGNDGLGGAVEDATAASTAPSASSSSPAPYSAPFSAAAVGSGEVSFSSSSPLYTAVQAASLYYPLASATVGASNAGDRAQQTLYNHANIDHTHPPSALHYYQPPTPLYTQQQHAAARSPAPSYYDQASLAQQQADLYSSMYSAQMSHLQHQQQQQTVQSAPLAHNGGAFLLPQTSPVYSTAPMAVAGPTGTFVYFPNAFSSMNGLLNSAQQPQVAHVQHPAQSQMAPPGFLPYYQQQQPSLAQQQPAHLTGHQQQTHSQVSLQQPVAYVNGIPMYLTPAPPNSTDASEQQQPFALPYSHHPQAHHPRGAASEGLPASSAASIASTLSSSPSMPSSPSARSHATAAVDADRVCMSTYKTEICRSHQYSLSCEYGPSCQFAHGLSELRAREVDVKFKTERCKNFHHFGPSTCWYGPRCKFIHDEFRVRVGAHEFWLISPRENMVRVEKVDPANAPRLTQLTQLIAEQTGAAQLAAQELMQHMTQLAQQDAQVESACEQLQGLHLLDGQPSFPKPDAAARFLQAIVSPQHNNGSVAAPINVQAMQVQPGGVHHHNSRGSKGLGLGCCGGGPHGVCVGLPSSPFLNSGHSHQQLGGTPYNSSSSSSSGGNTANTAAAAAFQHPPPRLPSPFTRRPPHQQPTPTYSSSPLSVLSNLLTPQALQLLSLNAAGGMLGRLDEPKKRKRIRKKKRPTSVAQRSSAELKAEDDSASSDLQEQEPSTDTPTALSDDEDDAEHTDAAATTATSTQGGAQPDDTDAL